eukprot:1995059-Lingulodinium_polyedra.AAC.1
MWRPGTRWRGQQWRQPWGEQWQEPRGQPCQWWTVISMQGQFLHGQSPPDNKGKGKGHDDKGKSRW